MTRVYFLVLFTLSVTICLAQDEVGSFEHEGYEREYEVYLPDDYTSNMPLIINIHGSSGNDIKWQKTYTNFHEDADTMGFVVVYPQGINNAWNTGVVVHDQTLPNTNDVGFISALIDTIKNHWDIDLSRVYCCGFSQGGAMSYRLAGELSYRIAAIAPVVGILNDLADSWNIIRPIPVLQINGTSDRVVPYEGRKDIKSASETIDYWLDKNNCSIVADTFHFPDIEPNDSCTMQKISYLDCSGESRVIHYKGIGMGHTWPGATFDRPVLGVRNMDINANVEILNFFSKFSNPLVNLAYGNSFQCNLKYVDLEYGDTIEVAAQLSNREKHDVLVETFIKAENLAFTDSFQLFDDGLHNDGLESDNIFGGSKLLENLVEDFFRVELQITDLDDSLTHDYHYKNYFTTVPQPEITDIRLEEGFLSIIELHFDIYNRSELTTLNNLVVEVSTLDSTVEIPTGRSLSFNNVEPNTSSTGLGIIYVTLAENFDGLLNLDFDISVDEYVYWQDSIRDFVVDINEVRTKLPTEFELKQNYPNPFNPSTTITYTIPTSVNSELPAPTQSGAIVNLVVYDILGKEITTLVNEKQKPGNYEVKWDGSDLTSGIYFYRLHTDDPSAGLGQSFVETKKMILLK